MKLEEGWVPVALSSSIEAGTSAGTVVFGSEIVVWRDTGGTAHVWEDRCPHRGMRLSFGFVRGDHIACLYHGWQYDAAGQCRYIPAHPKLDVPQTIKVPLYRVAETYGIVWATASADALLPDFGADKGFAPVRSISIDCAASAVLAVLGLEGPAAVITVDGDTLLVAVQAVISERTCAHVVLLGAEPHPVARQKHHARWAEALRFRLETTSEVA
ncbi:Rieske (2Fe-2S) protein [Rhizobium sp. 9140]|uniref:Rieske (2Fe-2S) protein n=1 Tax=Rhizobium sp. 9140 TaxID=1761900 RepID=UPI0007939A16|nr:Rieske (2Fe-2S) protein [Rhizobium sp. 9140]CZT37471.1 Rieske [2Fe-2S] domain-containing protein [Rhizobium sp. 9140]